VRSTEHDAALYSAQRPRHGAYVHSEACVRPLARYPIPYASKSGKVGRGSAVAYVIGWDCIACAQRKENRHDLASGGSAIPIPCFNAGCGLGIEALPQYYLGYADSGAQRL